MGILSLPPEDTCVKRRHEQLELLHGTSCILPALYRDAMFLTLHRLGGHFAAVGLGFVWLIGISGPSCKNIVGIYIELFRNTPQLVRCSFCILPAQDRARDPGGTLRRTGTGPFGRRYGGDFPSGLEASSHKMESALSLDDQVRRSARHLPQAVSISVPAFVANVSSFSRRPAFSRLSA